MSTETPRPTGAVADPAAPRARTPTGPSVPADDVPTSARRWTGTVLVAVLVSVGCVAAGLWQWHRHQERSVAVAVVEQNYDAAPVALADLLGPEGPLDDGDAWRTATATGRYLGDPVLLRNRPVSGSPALHVLQPFLIEVGPLTGDVLVVSRGWVPPGPDGSGADAPDAPPGTVELTVRLRPEEQASGRDAPPGQVQEIVVDEVRAASGPPPQWAPTAGLGAYGMALSENGGAPAGVRAPAPPQVSLGTNLSYAFQWWVFAVGALAAPVVLLRRERRDGDAPDHPQERHEGDRTLDDLSASEVRPPAAPSAAVRRRRRPTAEEEEDALLDAQSSEPRPSGPGPGRARARGPVPG